MTRITKMGGRKAPLKATDYFADKDVDTNTDADPKVEAQQQTSTSSDSATASPTPASTASPAQSSKSLQSRLKLLRLKIKKTTSMEKQNSLRTEMKDVERRIREENGRQGATGGRDNTHTLNRNKWASGANGSALGDKRKRKRGEDGAGATETWADEVNPWKRMEAGEFQCAGEALCAERLTSYYAFPERRSKSLQASTDRREKRAAERASSTRCFACRSLGHSAKECPEALNANSTSLNSDKSGVRGKEAVGICFRCGSTEHTLKMCKKSKKMEGGTEKLPFATCFVCGTKVSHNHGHQNIDCKLTLLVHRHRATYHLNAHKTHPGAYTQREALARSVAPSIISSKTAPKIEGPQWVTLTIVTILRQSRQPRLLRLQNPTRRSCPFDMPHTCRYIRSHLIASLL